MKGLVSICETSRFKPGDPAPESYLAWHAWAAVQHAAGLRQRRCSCCKLWRYPQELDDNDVCVKCGGEDDG